MTRTRLCLALALTVCMGASTPVTARERVAWTETADFDGGGDGATAVTAQPGGRILAAGTSYRGRDARVVLTRYLPDGRVDPGFGAGGRIVDGLGDVELSVQEVRPRPGGRILVVASTSADFVGAAIEVLSYRSDGTRDPAFGGGDGRVRLGESRFGEACGVFAEDTALQDDGKLVVVGTGGCGGEGDGTRVIAARLFPDGRLDRSFGHRGVQWASFSPNCSLGAAVAVERGKILIAGSDDPGCGYPGAGRFGLVRLTHAGRYDRSFSEDGRLRVRFPGTSAAAAGMALLRNGRILLIGTANRYHHPRQGSLAVARLLSSGAPDRRFGRNGRTRHDIPGLRSFVSAAAVTARGRIAIAATTRERASRRYRMIAAVLRGGGELESRFGRDGFSIPRFGGRREFAWDLTATGDGGFVVAGTTQQPTSRGDFAVTRYRRP